MEKTKMIKEAVRRMRILKICDGPEDSIARQFEESGKIYKSVSRVLVDETKEGELYALTDAEEKLVQDFENQSGYLVYYVRRDEMIDSDLPIGVEVQYSLLFVSDKENEWEQDRRDISGTEPYIMFPRVYAYSVNPAHEDANDLSDGNGEVTKMGFPMTYGGLYRIVE